MKTKEAPNKEVVLDIKDRTFVFERLSQPGFIRDRSKGRYIELTDDKKEADPLPLSLPFVEGTCEC